MIAANRLQDPSPVIPVAEVVRQVSEIAHDLKNCMSILLYLVETLGRDEHSFSKGDNLDDLKKLAHKMNCLVERLDSL